MPSLPVISGADTVKVFQKFGWRVVRQSSSHIIMTKQGEIASLSIPNHHESQKGLFEA
jgi:predicted RNA binding protein YcfA (HicA-like mRNA interferase family)